jgi:hypothetical protein
MTLKQVLSLVYRQIYANGNIGWFSLGVVVIVESPRIVEAIRGAGLK